ncbi:hypothetical protein ACWCQN_45775 [Streptomyces sp. NPDC001984]
MIAMRILGGYRRRVWPWDTSADGTGKPSAVNSPPPRQRSWGSGRKHWPYCHDTTDPLVDNGDLDSAARLLPEERPYPAEDELLAHLRS